MIPTSIIRIWFLGLLSWILLGVGIYLSHKWCHQAWSYDLNLQHSYFDPHFGNNQETRLLIIAASVLFLVLAGGLIVRVILSLLTKANSPKGVGQLPERSRDRVTISQLSRPDGSQLRVECHGREDAPPIILTRGWGANSTEWDYLKKELSGEFRLIVWDLPGLGRSTRPTTEITAWRTCPGTPLPTTGLASCHGTRHVGNASLRCNCSSQRHQRASAGRGRG
jgi:hypothetical protein